MSDLPDERPATPPTGGPAPSTDPKDFDNNDKRDALAHDVDPADVTPHHDMREAEYIQDVKERTSEENRSGGLPLGPDAPDRDARLYDSTTNTVKQEEPKTAAYTMIDATDGTVIGAVEADVGATSIETSKYTFPVTMVSTQGHGQMPVIFGPREALEEFRDKEVMVPPVWIGMNQGLFHGLAVRAMLERYVTLKDADDPVDDNVVTLDEGYLERQREADEKVRNPGAPPVMRSRVA